MCSSFQPFLAQNNTISWNDNKNSRLIKRYAIGSIFLIDIEIKLSFKASNVIRISFSSLINFKRSVLKLSLSFISTNSITGRVVSLWVFKDTGLRTGQDSV